MKTVCVLLTFVPVVDPDRPLADRLVADWLAAALDQALPGAPRRPLGPFSSPSEFLSALTSVSEGFEETVLVSADSPFLRADVVSQMLSLHRNYRADYTFADGYPTGLTCEILRPSLLPRLVEWAASRSGRDPLTARHSFSCCRSTLTVLTLKLSSAPSICAPGGSASPPIPDETAFS